MNLQASLIVEQERFEKIMDIETIGVDKSRNTCYNTRMKNEKNNFIERNEMKKQIIDTVNDIDIYDYGMFYLVKISGYVHTSKNLNYLKKLVRNRT